MGRVAVVGEGALEERGLGTQPDRLGDGHPGVDAELPRPVRGRLHHAALIAPPAHHEQLDVAQLGIALPAHLDEERVEVHVQDARAHGWNLARPIRPGALPVPSPRGSATFRSFSLARSRSRKATRCMSASPASAPWAPRWPRTSRGADYLDPTPLTEQQAGAELHG
jgi:hypothetical protein